MTDVSVHAALRSDVSLVAIEAPGGCGKTYQGATYARDIASSGIPGRVLILTHTHAACSVFHNRTRDVASHIEIRTIDSLVAEIASTYHAGLALPADAAGWARQNSDGYDLLAVKAAALLRRYPSIAHTLACRYPVIICDEHQDSSGERHDLIMSIHRQGAKLRVFADPMQTVFKNKIFAGGSPALDWPSFSHSAGRFEELDEPHRWRQGCPRLGRWLLNVRSLLKVGRQIDLQNNVPDSVIIVRAENQAHGRLEYRPANAQRAPIDDFMSAQSSIMALTRYNEAASSLRSAFHRRILIWEGHTRNALEQYVLALGQAHGNRDAVAEAIVKFVQETAVGFTNAKFANFFKQEVSEGCHRSRRHMPAKLQQLARLVVSEPDHRGASKVLRSVLELHNSDDDFRSILIDAPKEFREAIRLGEFEDAAVGLVEIGRRRTYTRPSPPEKCISTIHKAKGLECHSVVVMPCDASVFPDNHISRCLLYVAMSRPTHRLMLVVPRENPSPLLNL